MLIRLKEEQDEYKKILGKEYHDYGMVLATPYGNPIGATAIRQRFSKLIKKHNLPKVVFHSLRHTSVTYKLKLNGGDIKAVQGDSGHAQVNMVRACSKPVMHRSFKPREAGSTPVMPTSVLGARDTTYVPVG